MRRALRFITTTIPILAALATGPLLISPWSHSASAQPDGNRLSASAQRQIAALLAEKRLRTPAQKKIDSQLLFAIKEQRGEPIARGEEIRLMSSSSVIARDAERGLVEVEIHGDFNQELIETIGRLGGEIRHSSVKAGAVSASLPLGSLEILATLPSVRSIRQALGAIKNVSATSSSAQTEAGVVTSEGLTAHRVTEARQYFGATGVGVKVGVISEGVDRLAESIASGELPGDVVMVSEAARYHTVLSDGGTAMLEIIHDLAPGAKLFAATAGDYSAANYADNIRALRAAGCDIIVEGVSTGIDFDQSPFHDGIVSTAIEEVTADGSLFFTPAGDEGNFNGGTSGTWEGDFKDAGIALASLPGGTLHDFGDGVISNRVETNPYLNFLALWWSDPLGASSNDYDVFVLDDSLTTVYWASTNIQDGDDDPFEVTAAGFAGMRILIFKADGAEGRALHLNNFDSELAISTPGTTRGHNSARGSIGVAAVDVAVAGGGAFTGGPGNPVDPRSSDGFRRIFFKSDGTPFTPGNILFGSLGGEVRRKPDLTAAARVSTSIHGRFERFVTSAAAAHAAAIAALLKSARPGLGPNRIREALIKTALDIEAPGFDRDSGAGIVDAFAALQFIGAEPTP